ncbi:uncharacterized protein LOC116140190 [Pistacia vera]|uniref:uncharacterized protein LOC116140190 n=1 Tax=Pistacia vera TaxID=55513 RepID=UPI001263E115|nr:uncharacterized protein LOC116140190 [Pistacia vera]
MDDSLNIEALEKKPWDDLCLVPSKIIIVYQKQKQEFNNEEIVRNEDLSQESGESREEFNSQNILNEEVRECEEDFDSQNRVNEEGKHKQLSLSVLATVISSTLHRASKFSEMFWHASSPVISCIS